ncbi:SCP-like protein [Ostertagia ostertagi]
MLLPEQELNIYVGEKLNYFRQSVANGTALMAGGYLPSTLSMFTIDLNSELQMLAYLRILNCTQGNQTVPDKEVSMNYFSTGYLPSSITSEMVADIALGQWELQPLTYGIGNDVMYTNEKLQEFANMVHYKSTEYGCHYQVCNNAGMPPMTAFACVFNNPPMMNEPLYIASTQGQVDGCNDDSNCDQYMPFAKCHTTASEPENFFYKGLCYSTNETMFITSATEATSASTTEMATEESTTMAETTEASSMTTEETTMTTEETSMTTEETTMGMTTEETTMGMTTEETTMGMTTEETTMGMTTEETTMETTMGMTTEETTMGMTTEETTMGMTEETTMGMTTEETTMEASTTTTPFYNPMTDIIRTNITNMHNYRRSRLAQGLVPNGMTGKKLPQGMNIFNLTYSLTLEHAAQAYANTCPSMGSGTQGENFATISTSEADSTLVALFRAIQSFWRVIKTQSITEDMVVRNTLLQRKDMLPFTQMAWANTYEFGCGAKLCGNYYAVVCRYNTPGNILGFTIYDVGPMCGECPDICTTAYLYKGLCPYQEVY